MIQNRRHEAAIDEDGLPISHHIGRCISYAGGGINVDLVVEVPVSNGDVPNDFQQFFKAVGDVQPGMFRVSKKLSK